MGTLFSPRLRGHNALSTQHGEQAAGCLRSLQKVVSIICASAPAPGLSCLSLLQGDQGSLPALGRRAKSALRFDFGSSVTGSYSGPLPWLVLAFDVYLAYFVQVRISVKLFMKHFNGLIVLRGTFATKGNHHLFHTQKMKEKPAITEIWVWDSVFETGCEECFEGDHVNVPNMLLCVQCSLSRSHGDPSNFPHGT